MKKSIQLLVVASVTAVLCLFGGCHLNNENSEGSSVSEQSFIDSIVGNWQSEKRNHYIYTFNADGTGQYDMDGNVIKLNYDTKDGKITLTFLADGYTPVTLDYELDDNRLNIIDSFGKDTFYTKINEQTK